MKWLITAWAWDSPAYEHAVPYGTTHAGEEKRTQIPAVQPPKQALPFIAFITSFSRSLARHFPFPFSQRDTISFFCLFFFLNKENPVWLWMLCSVQHSLPFCLNTISCPRDASVMSTFSLSGWPWHVRPPLTVGLDHRPPGPVRWARPRGTTPAWHRTGTPPVWISVWNNSYSSPSTCFERVTVIKFTEHTGESFFPKLPCNYFAKMKAYTLCISSLSLSCPSSVIVLFIIRAFNHYRISLDWLQIFLGLLEAFGKGA